MSFRAIKHSILYQRHQQFLLDLWNLIYWFSWAPTVLNTVYAHFEMQEPSSDVLTTFLLSVTTLTHTETSSPSDSSDYPAHSATHEIVKPPSVPSRRLTQREQLQELRQEVLVLSQHLQQLHENQELQQSLDRLLNESTVTTVNWKEAATRERHAKETGEEKKAELMRRISINMSFLENVKRVLLTHARETASRPSPRQSMRCMPFVPNGDDAQVYRALRASIDFRCSQLDAILQQCVASRITTAEGHESYVHADGRGLDVREHSIKPFDMTAISETVSRYVEERANFCWRGENDIVSALGAIGLIRPTLMACVYSSTSSEQSRLWISASSQWMGKSACLRTCAIAV